MDELIALLRQESYLHDATLYPRHPKSRLVCHPSVFSELMKVVSQMSLLEPVDVITDKEWGIPATVDATMDPGTWQLIAGEGTI